MRITLILESAVASKLKSLQEQSPEKSFDKIVNEVINTGLAALNDQIQPSFRVTARNAVPNLSLDFDNISGLISFSEDDMHK